ncbi:MAG: ATP-binding cassette domain-containing protein [Thermoanaerobaculia bacterium]|nr:ATP-binding cassette domain-containing protein [Thermoanaerobaculia bacterium]
MTTPLVATEGLAVHYPGRRRWAGLGGAAPPLVALDDVSLTVAPGESLALVGESGSGKSTLGRCLLALQAPTRGRVRFRGVDLATVPATELRRLRRAFQPVFQDPSQALPPHRRVRAIVAEPLLIHGLENQTERVAAVLARVGLGPDLYDRRPHELSGGQRQRVAIARALILAPDLLVADEPVSALDAAVRRGVLDLLGECRRELGLTLVLISHDLGRLEVLADRVAVLYAGRLVEVGPAGRVLGQPRHPYTAGLVAAAQRLAGRRVVPARSVISPPEDRGSGCAFALRCPRVAERCRREAPPVVSADGAIAVACFFPLE